MKYYIIDTNHNEILSNDMHNPNDRNPRYYWYDINYSEDGDIIPFESYKDAQLALKNEKKAWEHFTYDTSAFKIINENEYIAYIL
jgi:hypothetical protein